MKKINLITLTLFLGAMVCPASYAAVKFVVKVNNQTNGTPYVRCGMLQIGQFSSFVHLEARSKHRQVATFTLDNFFDNAACSRKIKPRDTLTLACSAYRSAKLTDPTDSISLELPKCINKTVVLDFVGSDDDVKIKAQ